MPERCRNERETPSSPELCAGRRQSASLMTPVRCRKFVAFDPDQSRAAFRVHSFIMPDQKLRHLERRLPRYTSYPTAPHFSGAVDAARECGVIFGRSPKGGAIILHPSTSPR
jgi:hypothetical protein